MSSHDCSSGLQYYTCHSNGFAGCCSVDPCNSSGCPSDNPDTDTATTAPADPSPTSAAASTASASASASQNTIIITAENTITVTSNGAVSTAISSFSTATVQDVTSSLSPSLSATPSTTPTPPSTGSPSAPNTNHHSAIIGGSVGGAALLLIVSVLVGWLYRKWQRREKEKGIRTLQHDDDPHLQDMYADKAGHAFKDEDGKSRKNNHSVCATFICNNQTAFLRPIGNLFACYSRYDRRLRLTELAQGLIHLLVRSTVGSMMKHGTP